MLLPEHPAITDGTKLTSVVALPIYKPRAEEERQKKDELKEAMRRRRAEAKAAKKDEAK